MLPRRIYLSAILLLAFSVGTRAQEPAKAVLVDEFGDVTGEDVKARTDSFLAVLSQNPADLGYVIVSRSANSLNVTRLIIRANIFTRQFDRNRILVRLAPKSSSNGTQFWRIPSGSEPPQSEEFENEVLDMSKAFMFSRSERHDLAGICPTFSPEHFADLILQNPGSKARLVIFGPSSNSRQAVANHEMDTLLRYSKFSRKNIELYFVHRPNLSYTETEYWYIPAK